ncbi:unnamed protein product [Protopolystoma xenopodis]|uniref:Uncharacterized protein n=1 Tax=Protopolystoma xenopodis TaxID=117903 RepID=A0A448X0M2_9PLAT|nr:unnamed protein product [Protopolystoma xenopodis]
MPWGYGPPTDGQTWLSDLSTTAGRTEMIQLTSGYISSPLAVSAAPMSDWTYRSPVSAVHSRDQSCMTEYWPGNSLADSADLGTVVSMTTMGPGGQFQGQGYAGTIFNTLDSGFQTEPDLLTSTTSAIMLQGMGQDAASIDPMLPVGVCMYAQSRLMHWNSW